LTSVETQVLRNAEDGTRLSGSSMRLGMKMVTFLADTTVGQKLEWAHTNTLCGRNTGQVITQSICISSTLKWCPRRMEIEPHIVCFSNNADGQEESSDEELASVEGLG